MGILMISLGTKSLACDALEMISFKMVLLLQSPLDTNIVYQSNVAGYKKD